MVLLIGCGLCADLTRSPFAGHPQAWVLPANPGVWKLAGETLLRGTQCPLSPGVVIKLILGMSENSDSLAG